jgi:hypothetical protein
LFVFFYRCCLIKPFFVFFSFSCSVFPLSTREGLPFQQCVSTLMIFPLFFPCSIISPSSFINVKHKILPFKISNWSSQYAVEKKLSKVFLIVLVLEHSSWCCYLFSLCTLERRLGGPGMPCHANGGHILETGWMYQWVLKRIAWWQLADTL